MNIEDRGRAYSEDSSNNMQRQLDRLILLNSLLTEVEKIVGAAKRVAEISKDLAEGDD